MNKFVGGIMFAIGMHMFGKACYGLGKLDAKREARKEMKKLYDACDEVMVFIEEMEKNEEA